MVFNDPEKLEVINQKLQLIYNLQKKHNVQTVEELLEIQSELESKVVSVSTLENEIEKLENNIKDFVSQLDKIAANISKSRREAVPNLTEKLIVILNQLGMPNVRFKIEIIASDNYHNNGKDTLQFCFQLIKEPILVY